MGKWLLYLALGCCSTLLHAQTTADDETEQALREDELVRRVKDRLATFDTK